MTGRDGNRCEHDVEPGWVHVTPTEARFLLDCVTDSLDDDDAHADDLVMAMVVSEKLRLKAVGR